MCPPQGSIPKQAAVKCGANKISGGGSVAHSGVTVKWQNLSAKLTSLEITRFLDLLGFQGRYLEAYAVLDQAGEPIGHAVVNFHAMEDAVAFKAQVHGKNFGDGFMPCEAVIESVQNLHAHTFGALPAHVEARDLILDSPLLADAQQPLWEPLAFEVPARVATIETAGMPAKVVMAPPRSPPLSPPMDAMRVPPPPGLSLTSDEEDQDATVPEPVAWPEGVSTAMIRHIACRFMKEDVAEVLNGLGFKGKYDGIRIPRRPNTQSNLGYAFVNFSSPEVARQCQSVCHGRSFGQSYTMKLCEVVPAHIQGSLKPLKGRVKGKRVGKALPQAPQASQPSPIAITQSLNEELLYWALANSTTAFAKPAGTIGAFRLSV